MRSWHEECGVVGVYGSENAAEMVCLGLHALQHRGQEGSGIVSFDSGQLYSHRGLGLVSDLFGQDILEGFSGHVAVGHNRYSTTGSCTEENLQPLIAHWRGHKIALCHNGNLVNAWELRRDLEDAGAIFQTSSDSEVIVHLLARSRKGGLVERVQEAIDQVSGAFSLILSDGDTLIGARDPRGFRPLCLGRIDQSMVIASESCALDLMGAEYVREIEPGEMVVIDKRGIRSIAPRNPVDSTHCIFEYVYFSRPDSIVFGHSVDPIRRRLGQLLAEEHPADADIVISVPDSSNSAALGFAEKSGIPFELGLIRNHYVGRTFIQPSPGLRDLRVRIKYNPIREVMEGKRVVVVDDSIVRGTTMRKLVKIIRRAGAREVHLRISSPPIAYPCFYGIDTPTRGELIASSHTVDEIRTYLRVDDVAYLSLDNLIRSAPEGLGYCTACFCGDYPVEFETEPGKEVLEDVVVNLKRPSPLTRFPV